MEKWKITGIMSKESYINKIKDLPEFVRQFLGLIVLTIVIILNLKIQLAIFLILAQDLRLVSKILQNILHK